MSPEPSPALTIAARRASTRSGRGLRFLPALTRRMGEWGAAVALLALTACVSRPQQSEVASAAPEAPTVAPALHAPSVDTPLSPGVGTPLAAGGRHDAAGDAASPMRSVAAAAAAASATAAAGSGALLAYADRIRSMSPGELAPEISRLNEQADLQRTPLTDLQLALALSQTRNPQDAMRAQALMQRVGSNPSDEARPFQPLARLLLARYSEQRRLEEQIDRQAQQLRDSQRRIEQLNERLEAVRAIERSLTRSGSNGSAAASAQPAPAMPAARQ